MRGKEWKSAPSHGTQKEAERLRSAVQERALPEPAAEGVVEKTVEDVEI